MPEELITATVVNHQHLDSRLRILRVQMEKKLQFLSGQFTKIGLVDSDGKTLLRAYSFVNSPDEDIAEFYYDVLHKGGNLTVLLNQLKVGDQLLVSSRPNGLLILKELPQASKLFLIATGTGIGPFISILKSSEAWQKFCQVTLLQGVRFAKQLAYQDIINKIRDEHGDKFCYIPLVSRDENTDFEKGRATTFLSSGGLERVSKVQLGADCQFMMCGNPDMIKEMCLLLKERGFERNRRAKPGNVTIEKYW